MTTASSTGANEDGVSIVVPAYNEEASIAGLVEHLVATASGLGRPFEIIVVDDGSADCTGHLIDGLARRLPQVTAIHLDRNRGFGAAVRTGLERARLDLAMFCPADYAFSRDDFDIYLAIIRHCDIVIGYRRLRRLELPFFPRLVSSVYHVVVNLLFGLNFFDVNWIHMYRRRDLASCMGASDGVFFLAETLVRARRRGRTIIGVDVAFTDRKAGVPTGIRVRTIARTVRDLVRFFRSSGGR